MHEARVSLKRAQETLGHASERTTLAICMHSMRRTHDDSVDKIVALAGLSVPLADLGNIRETIESVEYEGAELSVCIPIMAPRDGFEPPTNGLPVPKMTSREIRGLPPIFCN
jgi:hypothetical protein